LRKPLSLRFRSPQQPMPTPDDLAALRKPFPHLRERNYLDTAAAGLVWDGHGAAVAGFYDKVKSRGYDARPQWQAMTQRVRARLAAMLGVAPADVTFVSNTTEGLNLAAHSLRFDVGDRIVLAADEFPSVARIWDGARRAGAEVVAVPIASEEARQSELLSALDARARLLVVSQTHSSTGTTVDLDRLGRHCRERGVLLMVDGVQAFGAVPIELSHVDVYAASFFKWMLSGFGVGVLVTSARARAAMQPAYRGYANMEDASQLQYAHVNVPAMYGLDATLDFLEQTGWSTVHRRVRDLGTHLIAAAARRGLDLVTPAAQRAGIFVLRCADGEAARQELAARNISVSARGQGVRISPHFYNTTEEIDQCLSALAEIVALPRGSYAPDA
jgi:cysteine desulfurase / selenocysteine lyase